MSLPRFYSRISNAIEPIIGPTGDLAPYLADTTVLLRAEDGVGADPVHRAGFVFATNLCGRLYPRLRIVAEKTLADECASLVLKINSDCDVVTERGVYDAALIWGGRSLGDRCVTVGAEGWRILIDQYGATNIRPTNVPTALAAAAFGVGEIFRTVF